MSNQTPIPCHVIAGPLGVGKTTAIIDLLRRRAGREYVAVLVNDFGSVGIDGALIGADAGGEDSLAVQSIPGGCICCTAAAGLATSLKKVLELPNVNRVIVEPSGVVATGQLVDVLRQVTGDGRLDVRPVVVLMDPSRIGSQLVEQMPYFSRLVEAADVLVANRCDLASDEQMADFRGWSSRLYPQPMRILETTQGVLPDEVLELQRAAAPSQVCATCGHVHDHDHKHEHTHEHHRHHNHDASHHAGGLSWPAAQQFDDGALMRAIHGLCETFTDGRFKGVFHTTAGWQYIDIAGGRVNRRATEYRRDNRVDWIAPAPGSAPGNAMSEAAMRATLEAARVG